MKKKNKVILIVAAIALLVAVYFSFFFSYSCKLNDIACFRAHQEKCVRTEFVNDAGDATWSYHITGKKNDLCEIEASIIQVKEGSIDKENLAGKSMVCSLSLGSISPPESDLKGCHGLLKEEIQELMIQQAHKYIVKNIGQIGEELNKVV